MRPRDAGGRAWDAIAALIVRWRLAVFPITVVAVAATAFGLARLEFDTRQDTLVPPDSQLSRDNRVYQEIFGGGEIVAVFEGDVAGLLAGDNLARLEALHAQVAADQRFARAVSPLTILLAAEAEVQRRTAEATAQLSAIQSRAESEARQKALAEGKSQVEADIAAIEAGAAAIAKFVEAQAAEAGEFGEIGELSRTNPDFVRLVVFEGPGTVRKELQGLVPDAQHALFIATTAGNLSIAEQQAAANAMRRYVATAGFSGVGTRVTGETILLQEITESLEGAIPQLAIVSVLLMVVVVLTVFRARWRLLHLPVVFVGLAIAFGLAGWMDLPLTMASVAGLPILVGLSVDFGIQFHTRYEEELDETGQAHAALRRSLRTIGSALVVAGIAAVIGFAALRYSGMPMIRDFSVILSVGLVIVFLACLFLLHAVLVHRDRRMEPPPPPPRPDSRMERLLTATNRIIGRVPVPILVLGLAVGAVGFAVDPLVETSTEPEEFLPAGHRAIEDIEVLKGLTATANQINLLIRAERADSEAVLAWMSAFEARALAAEPRLTGAESLAALLRDNAGEAGPDFSPAAVEAAYAGTPADIIAGFISSDRTAASITFTVRRDVKLIDQAPIIKRLVADAAPPPGVTVAPAGLGVLGVEAETRLTSNRVEMTVIAVAGAFLLLLLVTRNVAHALIAMAPVVLVVGWTSFAMWVLDVPLNPLTAIAAPLVVALGTEFNILLLLRYREECARGLAPPAAMARAYRLSGRAIVASALTIAGAFVTLAFNGVPLLSDFGIVSVVGVLFSLGGAMLFMPPLLVWADERLHLPGWLAPRPAGV
jgi:hydrophobe/amphiphile efflux-3 (HAE3) family protein